MSVGDDAPQMTSPQRTLRSGWAGRYFEDFTEGDIYEHPLGRTVLETPSTAALPFAPLGAPGRIPTWGS